MMEALAKPIRVCVLACSYEDSDSELKEYEGNLIQTPQNYFGPEDDQCRFHLELIKKATAYRQIRQLVMSGKYDVFYNQCDGAKDEDRAGVEVVEALEEFKVPYTGAISKYYEMSKPDMKLVAYYYNVATANYSVLEPGADIESLCAGLQFPCIIKHISGYSSVGMDKSCKVYDLGQLVDRATRFMEKHQFALVEEFVSGDEATILACNDSTQPEGVRVFPPVQVTFPEDEDFKHFELKWASYEGMQWTQVPEDDPAMQDMIDIARSAFKHMMGGIGYGRIDVRIDRQNNNKVVFLEINPNCGIMYPYGQEGSADWILRLNKGFQQRDFAMLQIREAISRCRRERLLYVRCFDPVRGYHLRAAEDISIGTIIFHDECRPVRLCTKPYAVQNFSNADYVDFQHHAWPLGRDSHYYALWDHDPAQWRAFNHSCEPNMSFAPMRSLDVVALRNIPKGEELTMDYRHFMDSTMPGFQCHCGTEKCEGFVSPGSLATSPSAKIASRPTMTPLHHIDTKLNHI
ncbi:D-ala D-ala ligase C-terminus/SET domain containing protein, putative [Leishmania tarentolae]|uniref:D-ala D-ala ligase C-terminus/SET domain containing protein, putative n=1 Tax=Leishmania tarentolae TaxID=5689 RepID=A0A640KJE7_LEITA|nr:D-ala D-ala ligase C-terminus/SET domain containing protein, putative [Leishmania tarentolae]